MDVLVHTEPTVEELRGLFRYLKAEEAFGFLGDDLRDEERFITHFMRSDIKPMVFEVGGQCLGVIWLASYEPFARCAWIHYALSRRHVRPLLRAARAFLDAVMECTPDYERLFAVFDEQDRASARLCELFGFLSFTRDKGKVFAMRI